MPFRSALFLKIAINSFVKKVVQDLTSGGSDPCIVVIVHDKHRFLSPLPARGATERLSPSLDTIRFLSTLPARGATGTKENFKMIEKISIHAPREGSDEMPRRRKRRPWDFYPRSPRGERPRRNSPRCFRAYFYPRSPRGERRRQGYHERQAVLISIHAPREGSDPTQ